MALVRTTLSAAVAVNDSSISVASATSIAAGRLIVVDDETMQVQSSYVSGTTIPVLRGRNGSATKAHVTGSGAVHGDAADFANPAPQAQISVNRAIGRMRETVALNASGAIGLPTPGTDRVAILNGTTVIAGTLASPGLDQDGDILYIVGNGKAAHTVTYTGGLGAGGTNLDVLTFAAGAQQCVAVIAANGIWVPLPSVLAGTLTNITVTAS